MWKKRARSALKAVVRPMKWLWGQIKRLVLFLRDTLKKLIGWTSTQVSKVNSSIDKVFGDRMIVKGPEGDSFWALVWEEFRKVFTWKYWVKRFIWVHVVLFMVLFILAGVGGVSALFGRIAPAFTPEVQRWEPKIVEWANMYDLSPNEVATVMQYESCGNPKALSIAGAQGLFQVMPLHFEAGEDMDDPETNARRGMAYLAERKAAAGGDIRLAFAQYHGGPDAINPDNWGPDTARYVELTWNTYKEVSLTGQSATLEEWLEIGGYSFCAEAAAVEVPLEIQIASAPQLFVSGFDLNWSGLDLPESVASVANVVPIFSQIRYGVFAASTDACDARGMPVAGGFTQYWHSGHSGIDLGVGKGDLPPQVE